MATTRACQSSGLALCSSGVEGKIRVRTRMLSCLVFMLTIGAAKGRISWVSGEVDASSQVVEDAGSLISGRLLNFSLELRR